LYSHNQRGYKGLSDQRAVQQEWVAAIDPDRTARKARIVDSSDLLQGMSFHRGHGWFVTVSDAPAERRG
jgi:hypothetical protein